MYEAANDYIYDAMVMVMHAIGVRGKKKRKKMVIYANRILGSGERYITWKSCTVIQWL